jgi:hypothetical protein
MQTCLGMSRDDSGSFLPPYTEAEIVKKNPFASIDQTGVGQLVKMAVEKGNQTRPGIKLGICGEHGGEQAEPAPTSEVLPQGRPDLRELLAVPRAGGPPRRRPGRDRGQEGRRRQEAGEEEVAVGSQRHLGRAPLNEDEFTPAATGNRSGSFVMIHPC